jgi:hypothetical protein
MRWKSRMSLAPKLNQKRKVRKFLLLPRQFGESDWRWLEWAVIEEQVQWAAHWNDFTGKGHYRWVEVGFVDDLPER